MNNTSLTFLQRLNEKPNLLPNFSLYTTNNETPEAIIRICTQILEKSSSSIEHILK